MYSGYYEDITQFNAMYNLPTPYMIKICTNEEIDSFVSILGEEITEAHDVKLLDGEARAVAMADWVGDCIVYLSTFARRQGLPMAPILHAIMTSNFSKLGADGQPIYDARGKVLKGPLFVGPELEIAEVIRRFSEPKSDSGKEL